MFIGDSTGELNRLKGVEDMAEYTCKIKLRGVSSRTFEKKQYGVKLVNEEGEEKESSLLGMPADEDRVLSNSILDF